MDHAQLSFYFPEHDALYDACVDEARRLDVLHRLYELDRRARRIHSSLCIGSVPQRQPVAVAVREAARQLFEQGS